MPRASCSVRFQPWRDRGEGARHRVLEQRHDVAGGEHADTTANGRSCPRCRASRQIRRAGRSSILSSSIGLSRGRGAPKSILRMSVGLLRLLISAGSFGSSDL